MPSTTAPSPEDGIEQRWPVLPTQSRCWLQVSPARLSQMGGDPVSPAPFPQLSKVGRNSSAPELVWSLGVGGDDKQVLWDL